MYIKTKQERFIEVDDEYFMYFFEICGNYSTYKEAYYNCEKWYKNRYKINRYSSYHSFCNGKKRYLLRLRKR